MPSSRNDRDGHNCSVNVKDHIGGGDKECLAGSPSCT